MKTFQEFVGERTDEGRFADLVGKGLMGASLALGAGIPSMAAAQQPAQTQSVIDYRGVKLKQTNPKTVLAAVSKESIAEQEKTFAKDAQGPERQRKLAHIDAKWAVQAKFEKYDNQGGVWPRFNGSIQDKGNWWVLEFELVPLSPENAKMLKYLRDRNASEQIIQAAMNQKD